MDIEQVVSDLQRRFSAPLPEFYHRRIIFWYDEEREFEEQLDSLSLTSAKILRMTGTNTFAVKKQLEHDDLYNNYLVYCPVSFERADDNWLLGTQLYSEEFRSDLVSIWIDEMKIPSTPALRKLVKDYRKFFGAKDRRNKIANQPKAISTSAHLHLAVMGVLAGVKNPQPDAILQEVMADSLQPESPLYKEFCAYGAEDAFWTMVAQATGYSEVDASVQDLICHVLINACTRTLSADYLLGLDRFISFKHQAWCYDFVSDWLHTDRKNELRTLAERVEETLSLPNRLMQIPLSDLLDTECLPCIHDCVLHKLMDEIEQNTIDADTLTSIVAKRRTCVWFEGVAAFYDGIGQIANMQRFFTAHAAGFHTMEAAGIWKEYTADYYQMDRYYRLFHLCYAETLKLYKGKLNDLFAQVANKVEGLYVHWYLDQLGSNWTKAIETDLANTGYVADVLRQDSFYPHYVRHADTSVVVIISDAMRYEVADSLAERLKTETQSQVELTAMQGVFPTITKFGIAALLPHQKLTVEERANGTLAVLADGASTDSGYRDKVLKTANPHSIALQYKDVVSMNTSQLRTLTTGMEVVYIYHDTIDAASHASETMVFGACETAIDELQNLVKIVINRMNRTHVVITADHGFLYTYSPLNESSKVDKSSFQGMDVEMGRRYAIMRPEAQPEYLMDVKFLDEKANLAAFAPRESMRLKIQGSGMNFVHGGISLQEMCVPVISCHRLRNDSKEYQRNKNKYDTTPVSISLLSANRKISNMIFSLNFYQKEAVGGNRVAQTYQLYFTDAYGKQISDVQKIIADKVGVENQDRTFRINFNLKQMKFSNTETYYLVITDEQGLLMPQREEFHIDIAFALDAFDFFA